MRSWWSPLRRRLAIVQGVRRRGDTVLFLHSFGFALAAPALMHIPLPRLDALLEFGATLGPRPASADPDAISATVLEMLRAGWPVIRRGCLTRGLTLYYVLRRAGVDVALEFGMGTVSRGDGFDGHCWLVLEGKPYLEPRDPHCEYATMYTFGSKAAAPARSAGGG
jgi:transglutaminase superfamily protein